ncbi:cellulose biosynthesis protein BcsN [Ensifer adhaerens]|nr:cellulose biosynthesis protein BcsN [Ensifer adhaerens]UAY02493.1 cellulose biosynthesis protein BcsN [Ensifer adhaerens]UAY10477.1 cellulose biosynthesis protein BcsN [Ensifer adhaerens]
MTQGYLIRRFGLPEERPRLSKGWHAPFVVAALLAATAAISGCTTRQDVGTPTGSVMVPPENALILPPPGGPAVLNVVERRRTNAIEQDIYLYTSAATPGQNVLRAKFFGPMNARFDQQNTSRYAGIQDNRMMAEARRALPGVPLSLNPYFLQNNYGPFGYAYGQGRADDACIFAWQQIRQQENHRSPLKGYGTIQIRLRYCAAGASEAELLSPVYGYTITGTFGDPAWNPYGAPPPVEAGLGRTGNPIYRKEQAPSETAPVIVTTRQAPPVVRREVRVAPATQQEKPVVSSTAGASIPLPGPDGTAALPQRAAKTVPSVIVPAPACDAQQSGGACP